MVAPGTPQQAVDARAHVETTHGIRAFGGPRPGPLPGTWRTELSIGAAGVEIPLDEAVAAWS